VAACLAGFAGRLHTTSAVVTEAMHMVSGHADGSDTLVEFLLATATDIAGAMRPAGLRSAVSAMRKYRDTPMDFADATLVLLAEELGVREILTLDRRGFSTYRTSRGGAFHLVLGSRR
jgi:predicted nucleic acid-binding protein